MMVACRHVQNVRERRNEWKYERQVNFWPKKDDTINGYKTANMVDRMEGTDALFREGGALHLLVRDRSDGIWSVDGQGRTLFFTDALPMLLGCSLEEMRGACLADCLPLLERARILEAIRKGAVVRGRRLRLRLPRGGGEERWFHFESMPTPPTPDGAAGAILVIVDATDQRHGEEARAILATLVETTDDAVFGTDLSHVVTTWNPGAERLFGYSREEALGKEAYAFVPSGEIAAQDKLRESLEAGEPIENIACAGQRKDGTRIELSVSVLPVFDAADRTVGCVLVAHDLTERRRAEILRAHLAAIVASSDDAIASIDRDGIVQSWNGAAECLFGHAADEVVGHPATRFLLTHHDQGVHVLEALRRGERIERLVAIDTTLGGRPVDVFVSVSPVRDGRGEIVGASAVAREVSGWVASQRDADRRIAELEARLEQRTEELRVAMAETEAFARAAVHDMRAPLRTVELCRCVVLDEIGDVLSPETRQLINRQGAAVARMDRLVGGMRDYAGLAGAPLAPCEFDLSGLARRVWEEVVREGAPSLAVEEGLRAYGDSLLVRIVLRNLFGNAVKFSPAGGAVCFGQGSDGAFFVHDAGVGFDMAHAEGLFRPFHRLVSEARFSGAGLGLAGVRRVVERHGGRVWAEGRLGEGAIFRFTLPAARGVADSFLAAA